MASIAGMAIRYRWGVLLFIGIPFIVWVASLLSLLWHPAFGVDFPNLFFSWFIHSLTPLLLGVCYLRVQSFRRPTLKLVWGYAFVAALVGLCFDIAAFAAYRSPGVDWWWRPGWWTTGVEMLALMIVLVWFAERASRVSFRHALLLIGLTTALVFPDIPIALVSESTAEGWSVSWRVEWWVSGPILLLGVSLLLLATWLVIHADSVDRVPKKAVLALLGLAAVLHIASALETVYFAFYAHFDAPYGFLRFYWARPAWYAVVILLTYRYDLVVDKLVQTRTYARRLWEGDLP